jgi:hypothetical protein
MCAPMRAAHACRDVCGRAEARGLKLQVTERFKDRLVSTDLLSLQPSDQALLSNLPALYLRSRATSARDGVCA